MTYMEKESKKSVDTCRTDTLCYEAETHFKATRHQ